MYYLYYINSTFLERVIVENIIPMNMIINRGAAEVDNHISRDDIFNYHPFRECNIYFIIPNRTLDPLFSTVYFLLDLPWWGEFQREGINERYIFNKNGSASRTDHWRSVKNYVIKTDDVTLHTKQRHLNGDTLPYAILMLTKKNA